jgi:glycerol-3-phosphate acyltransferase PlsY
MLINLLLIITGYLTGSLCSAIIVCSILHFGDPRNEGSGNPGATNVLRLYGKKAAVITLAGDIFKGMLPVMLAKLLQAPDLYIAVTGMAAFMGHLYPVYFRFRGGKGVATLVGVLSATNWLLGLAFIVTWLLVALAFRYSSLAAITASILSLFYTWILMDTAVYVICFSVMVATLIWRHRSNVRNLFAGTEKKIGNKAI